MADITITIPNAVLARAVDAVAARNGYVAATDGTKAQFAKKQLIRWVLSEISAHEAQIAAEAAAAAARASVTTDIVIT